MKQIIRLTEGDLHNIIRKSVNNIIQELDWKTSMNCCKLIVKCILIHRLRMFICFLMRYNS